MERVLRAGLTGLSAAALLAFIAVAVSRMGHPMPLEPAESVWLSETSRVLHGQPLMAEPSLAYIPLPAMPGFALLAALFGAFVGPQLWVLRLIAMLSTLGTAWLVSRAVKAETGSLLFAWVAVGLLFAAFAASGGRLDTGRPEALAWFLALAGLATLRFTTGAWGAMGAATLLALAFFTAAHTGWFALTAMIHVALNDRPRRMAASAGTPLRDAEKRFSGGEGDGSGRLLGVVRFSAMARSVRFRERRCAAPPRLVGETLLPCARDTLERSA